MKAGNSVLEDINRRRMNINQGIRRHNRVDKSIDSPPWSAPQYHIILHSIANWYMMHLTQVISLVREYCRGHDLALRPPM